MDKSELINKRRGRYLAKTLGDFEDLVLPLIPPGHEREIESFKSRVRSNLNALASDAADLVGLDGEINPLATQMRDDLFPHAAPPTRTP